MQIVLRTVQRHLSTVAAALCALLLLACALLRPAVAAQGVQNGLLLCAKSLIPSLFPFLILTRLVLTGSAAQLLGLPLLLYTRLLGLRSPKAATALLLGLTGGFCSGAKAVETLHAQGDITAQEASLLLCCTINSGLGFVVSGVGAGLLGSAATGWLLLAALSLASLLSALLCKLLHGKRKSFRIQSVASTPTAVPTAAPLGALHSFVAAVQDAVGAMLVLCGFVITFCFLTEMLCPPNANALTQFAIALPLEVTAACNAAAQSGSSLRAFLCCGALSFMGLSIFAQIRALTHASISLLPLMVSRLFHLPLSLGIFAILVHMFPQVLETAQHYTVAVRMPWEPLTAVFLLCAVLFRAPSAAHAAKQA